ncbi:hypothetical protein K1719_026121 [Acacia pycnantha]|nr:hypothetical protein K1719_026121 [Acacia pycnantha]
MKRGNWREIHRKRVVEEMESERIEKEEITRKNPLHSKAPSFIGDRSINLSWKEATKTASSSTKAAGAKRSATLTSRSNNVAPKKGRGGGGLQNQLANRALQGLPSGGRSGGSRGRSFGGRGRGYL